VGAEVTGLARPRRGHFDLGTGYHGDLWLDLDSLFRWPARLGPGVQQLAGALRPYAPAAVCGPWSGGAFLAQQLAVALGAAFLPAHPGPAGGYRVPAALRDEVPGWRVALVDDAINAGTAVRACHAELRAAGAVPVAVAALLALGPAEQFVSGTLGLPLHAMATLPSRTWPAADCALCQQGFPLG
jgi:orotate phosphoribosyltransferase